MSTGGGGSDEAGRGERSAPTGDAKKSTLTWKVVLVAGLVLLIVGVALAATARVAVDSAGSTGNSVPLTQYAQGEYVSKPFNLSGTGYLALTASNSYALVVSGQLPTITAQNVGEYAVTPTSSANVSSGVTALYQGLSGSYTLVEFFSGSQAPTISYVTSSLTAVAKYAVAFLGGLILVIAGLAASVAGVFLRRRSRPKAQPKDTTPGPNK